MYVEDKLMEYIKGIKINEKLITLLKSANRVIAFSPHPDDVEVIAGGYLAMMVNKGALVKVIVVSDGRMGMAMEYAVDEAIAVRRREELEAMKILGINDVEFLNYIDSEIPESRILRRDFIRIIRGFKPDVVVTVDPTLPYEAHPDHVNTGLAVMQAVLFHGIPRILSEYKVESQPPILALGATTRPNALICIDDYVGEKMKALRAHKSQFNDELLKYIELIHMKLGNVVGCKYAEAFKVLTPSELHMNPLAEYP